MSCRLKHLAVAAAIIGLATQVQAGYFPGSTDFDNAWTNNCWSLGDAEIIPDSTVPAQTRAANKPSSFGTPANVLSIDNDADAPVVCNIGGTSDGAIYADVLIKGTPLANDAAAPEYGPTDKILVYTRANGNVTNLCVLAKETANSATTNEFVLTKSIDNGWHRLVIKADNGTYQVFCDDDLTNPCETEDHVATFYPINTGNAMTSVAFAGSGSVDDVILTTFVPNLPVYTVTWDTSLASVKYTTGGTTTNDLTVADGAYQFQSSSPITIIANNGFRTFDDTYTPSSLTPTHALVVPTGLAYYTDGNGTEQNPYKIPCYEALVEMQKAVETNDSYRSASYVQTADITLDAPWPGIGLQNGKDVYTTETFNAAAFRGTYDGGNYTISDFQMVGVAGNPDSTTEGLDYCGFFNSTYGATIKNLKIAYKENKFAVDTTSSTKESGATFVGVAKGSTLSNLTTVAASVDCSKGFGGIVGYLTHGTTVDSCTNNVNITSLQPNKAGGIAMITQQDSNMDATAPNVLRNCQNNGTTTGSAEHGGLVGYVEAALIIDGCESTVADQLLNHYSRTITVHGVNKANANSASYIKHSGQSPANFDGLHFATVSNDVATFVYDGDLEAGKTYKVMGPGATATYEFTAPGSISFNTALATPTYAITSSGLAGNVTSATEAPVTTYTAGYFPRTATAGQVGTAANPFEIADLDDLQAFKATVEAQVNKDKYYVLTANIDMSSVAAWDGIGTRDDIPTAFTGTLDGAGFAINNLTLKAGKYSGFFDELRGTVKNLTINVAGFETTSAAEHGYAAFAGSTTGAVFENCVATGTIGTQAKPAMHTCGGFVVRTVTSPCTFVNCTNYVNIVCSLNDNPKVGGIVGLVNGSSATVSNCWNFGSLTITPSGVKEAANGAGGLVGYSQGDLTIYGGGNAGTITWSKTTAPHGNNIAVKIGTIIAMENTGKSATVFGGVVAQADAASAGARANITGLDFATVDNNVATFVSALESNNTYKVMVSGATASYEFAAPGTIAFDEAMYTPTTYAITAAEGLTVNDETVGTVKTFTAAAPAPAYPTYLTAANATIKAKYDTWAGTYGADTGSAYEAAFLLNANPQNLPIGVAYLKIASITQVSGGWELEIVSDATTLTAETNSSGLVGNGYLAIVYAADLATLASGGTAVNLPVTVTDGHIKVTVTAQNAKFMKATLSCTAEPAGN